MIKTFQNANVFNNLLDNVSNFDEVINILYYGKSLTTVKRTSNDDDNSGLINYIIENGLNNDKYQMKLYYFKIILRYIKEWRSKYIKSIVHSNKYLSYDGLTKIFEFAGIIRYNDDLSQFISDTDLDNHGR